MIWRAHRAVTEPGLSRFSFPRHSEVARYTLCSMCCANEDIAMQAIHILGGKCCFSTPEVGAGRLLRTVLAFSAYLSGDRPAGLVTASTSLSGELLCITVYSERAVYTAVLLSGQLYVSFATANPALPRPPASFLHPLAELEA